MIGMLACLSLSDPMQSRARRGSVSSFFVSWARGVFASYSATEVSQKGVPEGFPERIPNRFQQIPARSSRSQQVQQAQQVPAGSSRFRRSWQVQQVPAGPSSSQQCSAGLSALQQDPANPSRTRKAQHIPAGPNRFQQSRQVAAGSSRSKFTPQIRA